MFFQNKYGFDILGSLSLSLSTVFVLFSPFKDVSHFSLQFDTDDFVKLGRALFKIS